MNVIYIRIYIHMYIHIYDTTHGLTMTIYIYIHMYNTKTTVYVEHIYTRDFYIDI